jgi:hypothetical protein
VAGTFLNCLLYLLYLLSLALIQVKNAEQIVTGYLLATALSALQSPLTQPSTGQSFCCR